MKNESKHQQISELLARYAYILQTGGDAENLYPEVAHHLEQCPICQAILEDMLSISSTNTPYNTVAADELPFIKQPHLAKHMARPGGTNASFSLRIALPLADDLFAEALPAHFAPGPVRSLDAMQPGGRLIFYDTVPMGEQQAQIMLTLHQDPTSGQYTIVGELAAEELPEILTITVQIGTETYKSDIIDGKVVFENVLFDEEVKHIMITLEPPTTEPD